MSRLEQIQLAKAQTIFRAHEPLRAVYFPVTGAISLLTRLSGGETLDVGLVGKDGLAGVALLPGVNMMPCDAVVQMAGAALLMTSDDLGKVVKESLPFRELLGRYAYSLFAQGVQTAICNSFHSADQRCARWLLMTHDLAEGDEFPLTQSMLATMLGVHRPSVTMIARELQRSAVIDYRHGRIRILDRRKLEAASCECYRVLREEQQRLLGF